MGYKTPQPSVVAFPDAQQQALVRRVYERLDNLEQATNLQSFNNGRAAPAPPQAGLSVSVNPNVPGMAFVQITNPQFQTNKQNLIAAPIQHFLRASPYVSFNKQVTNFSISHQTHYTIGELGSGTFHFELTSTFDGQTFNAPVRSGPVTIP